MSDPVQNYLNEILNGILSKPFTVDRTQDSMGVLFVIAPNKEEMGMVLGKNATAISAIRRLMRQKGYLHGERVSLKVNAEKL